LEGVGQLAERAKRVSCSGGFSALSAVLFLWQALLLISILGALFDLTGFAALLSCRFVAGAIISAAFALKAKKPAPIYMALLYDLSVIPLFFIVGFKMAGNKKIEWGGIVYGD
jgi:hypothetical protein